MKSSVSGAILAGGTNQRFEGNIKANIVIEAQTGPLGGIHAAMKASTK